MSVLSRKKPAAAAVRAGHDAERVQRGVMTTAMHPTKRRGATRWANKWVQSPRWFIGFWIVVAVCLMVYALNAVFGRIHPGTAWGLGYGIAATVLLVAVSLYAARRRLMRVRALGRSWHYLQVHVYGGTLFLLLVFMHTGFGWPQGVLTWWLWALSIWVVASGLLGIVLQKWIPTLLNTGLGTEVNYARIPELVDEIRTRAEKIVASADHAVQTFYRDEVATALAGPEVDPIYFLGVSGDKHRAKQFGYLRPMLAEADRVQLDELLDLYQTKREMDAHWTLQKVLRGWLMLHVPVSVVLLALLIAHIFTVIYY